MTAAEFHLWTKLVHVEPWDEHVDLGLGQVAATVANFAGKALKDGAIPAHPSDFMPLPDDRIILEPDPVLFFKAN